MKRKPYRDRHWRAKVKSRSYCRAYYQRNRERIIKCVLARRTQKQVETATKGLL